MEWVISDDYCDLSNMFTYDIDRQSVDDKMVREISLEVREKSGKSQGILFAIFGGNPGSILTLSTRFILNIHGSYLMYTVHT